MEKDNWATKITLKIDNKLEGTKEKDIRFFRVAEFKRNILRVENFSASCPFCSKQIVNISETVEKIDEAISVPGKPRRNYDRLIGRLAAHIQKEHGFYPPFHFAYLFSFYGIMAGLILGFILFKLIPTYNWAALSLGFILGLIPGYLWGSSKDKKIRATKKLM